jgi:signal transduction histidine kinase
MSPMAWWQFGGEEGPIVEALNDIGVKCFILYPTLEDDAPRLSMELTPALYRLQCEAVGYLIKHAPTDDVRMHLRLDIENNRPLITTRVSSVGTPLEITKADYDDFLVNIGVAHIGERRLRERAQLYDGDLEIEPSPHHRMMITLRVRDKPIRVDE